MALLLTIIAASSILKAAPSIRRHEFGNDAYYHILVARRLRTDHRLPENDFGMVPEGRRGYPPLFHYLIAPFAGRFEKAAKLALSPSFDIATIVIVFLFAESAGVSEPIWPAAVFAFSPICVLQATTLNPRPLSCLLLAVSMLSLFWYWSAGEAIALVLALVFESLMFITHKMGVQALVVAHFSVSAVILLSDLWTGIVVAGVLPAAFLLAVGLTGGGYLRRTLRDHIGFIKVHMRHGDYRTGKKGLPSPIELVKSDPVSYFSPVAGFYLIVQGNTSIELEFLLAWTLGVVLLTQLWPFGDSWRHLAFASVPSSIISVMFVFEISGESQTSSLLLSAFVAAVMVATLIQLRRAVKSDVAQDIVEALKALPPDWKDRLRASTIYSNAVHNAVPLETGARVIGGNPNAPGVEFSLKLHEANRHSLAEVARLAQTTIGTEPEYLLVFKKLSCPDSTGYDAVFESEELRILVADKENRGL